MDHPLTAAPITAVHRNSPCPCGSGKRFKACHGVLGSAQPAAAALAGSSSSLTAESALEAQQTRAGSVVVLCRRAVDWGEPDFADRRSRFNQAHPLRKLQQQWHEQNPRISFHEYRRYLHQVARATWDGTGAQVMLNPAAMDQDDRFSVELVRRLRRADWIIPIDDDDWLAPGIVGALKRAPAEVAGAIWDSLLLHVLHDRCSTEGARPYLSLAVPMPERIVLSCAYAISRRAADCLSDNELVYLLMSHGGASQFLLAGPHRVQELGMVGSVHLRHQATAGSTTAEPDRALGDFTVPDEIADLAPWALRPLGEIKALHAACQTKTTLSCRGTGLDAT